MKIRTHLKNILKMPNSDLKLNKINALSLKCVAGSPILKDVMNEYFKLIKLGYKEVIK